MAIKTAAELVAACKDVAQNYKTLYVMGCFGAPMNAKNKARYTTNHDYNTDPARVKKINAATADTFGFDCVCLIKGLLWGWNGDATQIYGGAAYMSNHVPDIGTDSIITKCKDVSTNFAKIQAGELLWMKGHVGIYIGDGLCVECTPAWKDCVQITAVHNIGKKAGYNGRKWTKHGKLPYVTYGAAAVENVEKPVDNTAAKDLTIKMRTLRKGAKGEDVRALQILLIVNNCSCGEAGVDGSLGSATESAVRKYQAAKKLTVDGIVGAQTWCSLLGV